MLLIKTYLDKSHIEGIGAFAAEPVKKGALVWQFHSPIDVVLTPEQVDELPEAAKEFVQEHAYPHPTGANNYCLSYDNARYVNHSDDPNISSDEPAVALKDIEVGTELSINYYQLAPDQVEQVDEMLER